MLLSPDPGRLPEVPARDRRGLDIDQFVEIFGARVSDSSIRVPRAVERWFDKPKNDGERKIKALLDEHRAAEITKLEREVFAQKKRLADAERTLASKPTKAATESKRIATNKIEQSLFWGVRGITA